MSADPQIWIRQLGLEHLVDRWSGGFPVQTLCGRSIAPGWELVRDHSDRCASCRALLTLDGRVLLGAKLALSTPTK